ncbi:hypothetical protein SAMN04488101_11564 [Pedobacter nyackensis]|uniref:Uncharacterized protein n=1 Tax=Pedobacter nyackensis TaxID=475255 RepID=A0A1W2ES68_9SPHI|nr:hypothetical protein SAMN04488101_11564 [Pedobacter nyackensis]
MILINFLFNNNKLKASYLCVEYNMVVIAVLYDKNNNIKDAV